MYEQVRPADQEGSWRAHLPSGVGADAVALNPAPNLTARWVQRWAANGAHPAIEAGGVAVTADALEEATARAAGRLQGAGLAPGDRVLLSCASSVDLVVAHVACLRAQLVVVPANTAYKATELAHVVGDARPRLAIVDDAVRSGWIRDADPTVVVVGPNVELPDAAPVRLDTAAPSDPALIGYTSGTTGQPKGAVLSHANLLASVEALALAWRWTPEDRLWLCLPLFHMHGLGVGLHGSLAVGATAVLTERFDVDSLLQAAEYRQVSMFFGVPTMYSRIASAPGVAALANLRLCVSGSAPLPADLQRALRAASGQRVLERYGMTETVMLVSNPYEGERRPGTVGLPLPRVELRLDAVTAEVLVSGPNVFGGYLNQPDANAAVFTDDGYFRTGDIGELDESGYLRLVARLKELIITGGFNVYPREVEDALRQHAGVVDAAVVGQPDEEWGEIVVAYCEVCDAVSPAELVNFAAARIAGYKRPRRVHVVERLPRNALGKVVKGDLSP